MANKLRQAKLQMKADIIASRKLAAQSRRFGFKYTNLVNDAIYGNLATTTRGYTAQMTQAQQRQLAALRRLQARSNAKGTAIADKVESRVANLYGTATAGGTDFTGVNAQVRANALAQRGITQGAGLLAQGNAAAAATMASGLKQAEAAAQYQTAQALEYRAKNDAALIAEKQWQLHSMLLQNKLDLQNFRKKQQILQNLEGAGGLQGMTAVATTTGTAFAGLRRIFNSYIDANGNTYSPSEVETVDGVPTVDGAPVHVPNASEAAAAYFANHGVADPNQQALIQGVASAMFNAGIGKGPGTFDQDVEDFAINAVSQQMSMLYPKYSKYQAQIEEVMRSAITWQYSDAAVGGAQRGENVGDDNPWYDTVAQIALPTIGGAVGFVTGGPAGAVAGAAAGGAIAGAITTADDPGIQTPGEIITGAFWGGVESGAWAVGLGVAGKAVGGVAKVAAARIPFINKFVTSLGETAQFWKAAAKTPGMLFKDDATRAAMAYNLGRGTVVGTEKSAINAALGVSDDAVAAVEKAVAKEAAGEALTLDELAKVNAARAAIPQNPIQPLAASADDVAAAAAPKVYPATNPATTPISRPIQGPAVPRVYPATNPATTPIAKVAEDTYLRTVMGPQTIKFAQRLGESPATVANIAIRALFNPAGPEAAKLMEWMQQLGMTQEPINYALRWLVAK